MRRPTLLHLNCFIRATRAGVKVVDGGLARKKFLYTVMSLSEADVVPYAIYYTKKYQGNDKYLKNNAPIVFVLCQVLANIRYKISCMHPGYQGFIGGGGGGGGRGESPPPPPPQKKKEGERGGKREREREREPRREMWSLREAILFVRGVREREEKIIKERERRNMICCTCRCHTHLTRFSR